MWQNLDFRKLWIANAVSSLGSQITLLALPLTAVIWLQATPVQMGILAACGTLPYLVVGLPAGVWVDRLRRRPILITADVGRAILLATIPLLAALGTLRIEHLYGLAFLTGILSFLYDVTEGTYLPAIVGPEHLVEGNSQLAAIDTTAELVAPVVAGGLVELLTAPMAIVVDAASSLWSAFWLGRIKRQEARPAPLKQANAWQEMREGLAYLVHHPLLRPSLVTGFQWEFFGGMKEALFMLYLVGPLHLSPTAIGVLYGVGGVSTLVAARLGSRATGKLGPGPVAIGSALLLGLGWLMVPLAAGASWPAFGMIAAGLSLAGAGNMLWNVTTTSITQTITPNRLLGRVNASNWFLAEGVLPVGSLIGGWLGQRWGLRPTLLLCCSGLFLGFLWVWFSPLRALGRLPNGMTGDDSVLGTDQELAELEQ